MTRTPGPIPFGLRSLSGLLAQRYDGARVILAVGRLAPVHSHDGTHSPAPAVFSPLHGRGTYLDVRCRT